MLSRKTTKYVKSLQYKKYRKQHQAYLAEGGKIVQEVLNSQATVSHVIATAQYIAAHDLHAADFELIAVTEDELRQLGSLQQNHSALAVVEMPDTNDAPDLSGWCLALDGINDPGNLGTIIRIADWYGIEQLVCSLDTADFYNAKVLSASMGSWLRVKLHYTDLPPLLESYEGAVYGALLEGDAVYDIDFPPGGMLVIGSESHGIRPEVIARLSGAVNIPRRGGAESLNAGVATAILIDNIIGRSR